MIYLFIYSLLSYAVEIVLQSIILLKKIVILNKIFFAFYFYNDWVTVTTQIS